MVVEPVEPPRASASPYFVARPCDERFDALERAPDSARRHCARCDHEVHDLSAMTERAAARLVRRARGRLCVSYELTARGEPKFVPAHRLRRASPEAGAALTLALAACHAGAPAGTTADAVPARAVNHRVDSSPLTPRPPARAVEPASSTKRATPTSRPAPGAPPSSPSSSSAAATTPETAPAPKPAAPSLAPDPPRAPPPARSDQADKPPSPTTESTPPSVECLLDPSTPGCERSPRITGKLPPSDARAGLPEKPGLTDFKRVIQATRPRARACGEGVQAPGSKATLKLSFQGSGELRSAVVTSDDTPPAIARCLVDAFTGQRVPPFRGSRVGVSFSIRW